MKTENRSPGLDLIRCLAMLFVITYHFFLRNGFLIAPQSGIAIWIAGCFRTLSTCCIGLFLMLTGYLKAEKTDLRSCYRSLLPILVAYLLASALSIPIRHFFLNEPLSLVDWGKTLVQFTAVYYGWYVEMYLGLLLLIPFISLMLKQLKTANLLLLTAIMLLLTAMPGSIPWNIFPDYWRALYPITYYLLGVCVRRVQPKIAPWVSLLAACVMAILLATVTYFSASDTFLSAISWQYPDLWTVLMCICLFIGLYRVQFPALGRKLLAFGSMGCYGACLLSHLLDAWCYKLLPQWSIPERYILLFVCLSIPVYLISLVMGNLLQRITNSISAFIIKCLSHKQKTS